IYPHDYPGHFHRQQYLPDELQGTRLWEPADNPAEQRHADRMRALWGNHEDDGSKA
ncbi:MAG: replication-associated recombination protein A, partial [Alloprevotella sp.]|nr:replication-associated recombination protein A [Alloprevotella sp.]